MVIACFAGGVIQVEGQRRRLPFHHTDGVQLGTGLIVLQKNTQVAVHEIRDAQDALVTGHA